MPNLTSSPSYAMAIVKGNNTITQCEHFYKTNTNLPFPNFKAMHYHVSVCKRTVLRYSCVICCPIHLLLSINRSINPGLSLKDRMCVINRPYPRLPFEHYGSVKILHRQTKINEFSMGKKTQ